jgi:hypothetical protein
MSEPGGKIRTAIARAAAERRPDASENLGDHREEGRERASAHGTLVNLPLRIANEPDLGAEVGGPRASVLQQATNVRTQILLCGTDVCCRDWETGPTERRIGDAPPRRDRLTQVDP